MERRSFPICFGKIHLPVHANAPKLVRDFWLCACALCFLWDFFPLLSGISREPCFWSCIAMEKALDFGLGSRAAPASFDASVASQRELFFARVIAASKEVDSLLSPALRAAVHNAKLNKE
jgi:hypothetical protein